jgi:hypothetical protein
MFLVLLLPRNATTVRIVEVKHRGSAAAIKDWWRLVEERRSSSSFRDVSFHMARLFLFLSISAYPLTPPWKGFFFDFIEQFQDVILRRHDAWLQSAFYSSSATVY